MNRTTQIRLDGWRRLTCSRQHPTACYRPVRFRMSRQAMLSSWNGLMRGWRTSRSVAGLSFTMGVSTEYSVLTNGGRHTAMERRTALWAHPMAQRIVREAPARLDKTSDERS
jgi:hypothetical protein